MLLPSAYHCEQHLHGSYALEKESCMSATELVTYDVALELALDYKTAVVQAPPM